MQPRQIETPHSNRLANEVFAGTVNLLTELTHRSNVRFFIPLTDSGSIADWIAIRAKNIITHLFELMVPLESADDDRAIITDEDVLAVLANVSCGYAIAELVYDGYSAIIPDNEELNKVLRIFADLVTSPAFVALTTALAYSRDCDAQLVINEFAAALKIDAVVYAESGHDDMLTFRELQERRNEV